MGKSWLKMVQEKKNGNVNVYSSLRAPESLYIAEKKQVKANYFLISIQNCFLSRYHHILSRIWYQMISI